MKTAIVLCAVVAVSLASSVKPHGIPKNHRRIVDGSDAEIQNFPWQASLQFSSGSHTCGASIIDDTTLVTAAHCVTEGAESNYRVVVGVKNLNDADGQVLTVERFIQHPEYETGPGTFPNDVAVIKVAGSITMNDKVKEIKLADVDSDYTNDICHISGWGRTCGSCAAPDDLQFVEIKAYTNDECNSTLWEGNINDGHICLGMTGEEAGACFGDSGGPFSCRVGNEDLLAGITSWGTNTCDATLAPSVYSRVSHFSSWIQSQAGSQTTIA